MSRLLSMLFYLPLKLMGGQRTKIDRPKEGEWAVISGSTDGIGLEFAHQLSGLGYNLVLLGRDQNKMNSLIKSLDNKTQTRPYVFDFTDPADFYTTFIRDSEGMDISLLINNVGVSYEYPKFFTEEHILTYDKMLEVNMASVMNLTYILMMLNRDKRVTIINISSILADIPSPLLSLYGATKAFVSKLGDSITRELKMLHNDKITVYTLKPWLVSTKMSKSRPSLFCPDPMTYVQSIMTHGVYTPHEVLTLLARIPLVKRILHNVVVSKLIDIRYKALTNKPSEQKTPVEKPEVPTTPPVEKPEVPTTPPDEKPVEKPDEKTEVPTSPPVEKDTVEKTEVPTTPPVEKTVEKTEVPTTPPVEKTDEKPEVPTSPPVEKTDEKTDEKPEVPSNPLEQVKDIVKDIVKDTVKDSVNDSKKFIEESIKESVKDPVSAVSGALGQASGALSQATGGALSQATGGALGSFGL